MYQNTPLHKLGVDHSSITEVLRLHLLSSGAKQSQQSRGSCVENDDPGLYITTYERRFFFFAYNWFMSIDYKVAEETEAYGFDGFRRY